MTQHDEDMKAVLARIRELDQLIWRAEEQIAQWRMERRARNQGLLAGLLGRDGHDAGGDAV